jgi:hypothetical protein
LLLGAAVGVVVLVVLAALLMREPGSALKSGLAVWLVALPVLGLGALCGRLVATALALVTRRRQAGKQEY